MVSLFLFIFVTISLLIIASFMAPNQQNILTALENEFEQEENFSDTTFGDVGRPIHVRLGHKNQKPCYLSYQMPRGHGDWDCTQVPCPDNIMDDIPMDVKANIPLGYKLEDKLVCWDCCNYH